MISFDYGTWKPFRVNNAKVAFRFKEMTKDGSSKNSFMSQVRTNDLFFFFWGGGGYIYIYIYANE